MCFLLCFRVCRAVFSFVIDFSGFLVLLGFVVVFSVSLLQAIPLLCAWFLHDAKLVDHPFLANRSYEENLNTHFFHNVNIRRCELKKTFGQRLNPVSEEKLKVT